MGEMTEDWLRSVEGRTWAYLHIASGKTVYVSGSDLLHGNTSYKMPEYYYLDEEF